jgi:hypothetical protein
VNAHRPATNASELLLRIAICDILILGLAAGTTWVLGWRALAGFGRALLWTGGAAFVCGGAAAFVQGLLTRASRAVDLPAEGSTGLRADLAQALSGRDAVLQVLIIIAGSGVFWAVVGMMLVLVAG